MYVQKIHLLNYGPLRNLQLEFAFDGQTPKPIVLVGENGSGKSILLSHLVNALVLAKDFAFPETPEVEARKVYKLRSSSYISQGSEYYFGRVDFEDGFFVNEFRTLQNKEDYTSIPAGLSGTPAESLWQQMDNKRNDVLSSTIATGNTTKEAIEEAFKRNCVLYFPFNRYEDPAWLNEENLTYRARYKDTNLLVGYTDRKIIASSPLHDLQNWLFDVLFDKVSFELAVRTHAVPTTGGQSLRLPVFRGYSGEATKKYESALRVIRTLTGNTDARFAIGRRNSRQVQILSGSQLLLPNTFQLSSGETTLLNLFLSILRDADLSMMPFSTTNDIRGLVIVDEIDLHLHAVHQYQILPRLMRMFPKVQFVVTTHSPLFVLGMSTQFGESGFGLYRLPQGEAISPEEFSEFGDAYDAFTTTSKFSTSIRNAVKEAQSPILYVEGKTDVQYLKRAAELLGKKELLERIETKGAGGKPHLKTNWSAITKLADDLVPRQVMLLYDCDYEGQPETLGNRFKRRIPLQCDHPIQIGIENLFTRATLEGVMNQKPQFIDITPEYTKRERGQAKPVPEEWTVNEDEKMNLCNWLCENGTEEDFRQFQVVFDMVEEMLGTTTPAPANGS